MDRDPARRKALHNSFISNPALLVVLATAANSYWQYPNPSKEGLRHREFILPLNAHKALNLTEYQLRYALKQGEELWLWRYTGRDLAIPRKPKIYFYLGSEIFGDTYQSIAKKHPEEVQENIIQKGLARLAPRNSITQVSPNASLI